MFGHELIGELDADLIHNFAASGAAAIGQRTIVHGRVLDENGRGVPNASSKFGRPMRAGGIVTKKKVTSRP